MIRVEVEDGVRYAVRDDGAGMPVLLLHGFTGSGASWVDWLPNLALRYRMLAVDLLGHGDSDSPAPERHAIERQAADLATILRRLDAAPAHVLGYSLGARIALRLAVDAPGIRRRPRPGIAVGGHRRRGAPRGTPGRGPALGRPAPGWRHGRIRS